MATYSYPSDFKGTRWRVLDGDVYVSYDGNDQSNGHPQKPVATLQRAIALATAGQKIVAGTGIYNENVDGQNKSCTIMADGTVEMYGTVIGGAAFSAMGTSCVISGIRIYDYATVSSSTLARAEDCVIQNTPVTNTMNTLLRCIIKNSALTGTVDQLMGCTFIGVSKSQPAGGVTVSSCHFDVTSNFTFASATTQVFDYCNQETGSTIKIDGTVYNNAAAVFAAFPQYQENGQTIPPQFNATAYNDYTLKLTSPLTQTGADAQPVGAWPQAISYDSKQLAKSLLKGIVFDNDGYMTLAEGEKEGFIETFVIDLLETRVVGRIDLFAEQHFSHDYFGSVTVNQNIFEPPRPITFLMRFANNDRDILKTDYKEFIWDKIPTVDVKGFGNGSLDFNALNERLVFARYVQLRIILRHTSDSFFLLLENNDLLLQENDSKLKTENA